MVRTSNLYTGVHMFMVIIDDKLPTIENKKLLDAFLEETDSEHLRAKCEEGFRYLRQFNVDGHRSLIILPHTQLEPHFTLEIYSSLKQPPRRRRRPPQQPPRNPPQKQQPRRSLG